jgi:Rrf2 family protein
MLTLSTKGRYATRIMVRLAEAALGESLRVQEIAESEEIAATYVEQLLLSLKAAGLVRSHRGAKGGFSLARDPQTIPVGHVLAAMEGPICLVPCLGDAGCPRAPRCPTQPLWRKVNAALVAAFDGITIGEMAAPLKTLAESLALTYDI